MAGRFLYNTMDATCGEQSTTFLVDDAPVRLTASGLLAGQALPIEVMLSGDCTVNGRPCARAFDHWAPLVQCGDAMALTADSNRYIEVQPGTYRVVTASLPPAQPAIVLAEELKSLGRRGQINFHIPVGSCTPPAPCPAPVSGVLPAWG